MVWTSLRAPARKAVLSGIEMRRPQGLHQGDPGIETRQSTSWRSKGTEEGVFNPSRAEWRAGEQD
jgi:hypothetical protein